MSTIEIGTDVSTSLFAGSDGNDARGRCHVDRPDGAWGGVTMSDVENLSVGCAYWTLWCRASSDDADAALAGEFDDLHSAAMLRLDRVADQCAALAELRRAGRARKAARRAQKSEFGRVVEPWLHAFGPGWRDHGRASITSAPMPSGVSVNDSMGG